MVIDGTFVCINQRLAEMTGYAREELLGRSPQEFVVPEERERAGRRIGELLQGGPEYRTEYTLLKKDGGVLAVEVRSYSIRYRGRPAMLSFLHDITERRRTEDALRESEERFRLLAENAQDIIFRFRVAEPQGYEYMSPAVAALSGYAPEDFYADPGLAARVVHPDDREKFLQMVRERRTGPVELRWVCKNGTVRCGEQRNTYLYDDSGTLIAVEGIVRDTTDRKKAEDELRLLLAMVQAVSEAQNFDSALHVALSKVCEATAWDFGEAWVPSSDGKALACSPAWWSSSTRLAQFRRASQAFTFGPATGLPGRAWSSREPEWIEDISAAQAPFFVRAGIAAEAGLKAALGVPIVVDGHAVAVLAFFMLESRQEDTRMVELVSGVAAQLGSVFEHKQLEEQLVKAKEELEGKVERQLLRKNPYGLTFRELTVLHLVAAGRADKEIAGELVISRLTVHKHVANILHKMDAASRTEAGTRALREGLLD